MKSKIWPPGEISNGNWEGAFLYLVLILRSSLKKSLSQAGILETLTLSSFESHIIRIYHSDFRIWMDLMGI